MLTPALLIALALLIGLIVLVIKGGTGVRWFFGILLLLVVIGFFGLFSMGVVSHSSAYSAGDHGPSVSNSASHSHAATLHIVKDDNVWNKALEEEMIPDTYSSVDAAAYGLGMQLHETIQTALNNEKPKQIVLRELNVNFSLLEQLRQGLLTRYDDVKIVINPDQGVANGDVHIELKIHQERTSQTLAVNSSGSVSQRIDVSSTSGVVSAVVHTVEDKHVKEVRFDRRLWVHDPDAFRSEANLGSWAVFASSEPVVTKEDARNEALKLARAYVAEQVRVEGYIDHNVPLKEITSPDVQSSDLRDYGFIADEYTQRLQGLSGPIWRAAVLLDVSPQKLDTLRRDKVAVVRTVRKTWATHIISLVGMILLIGVLSMLVNALTKGYYAVVIVMAAMIAVAVFVLLMRLA